MEVHLLMEVNLQHMTHCTAHVSGHAHTVLLQAVLLWTVCRQCYCGQSAGSATVDSLQAVLLWTVCRQCYCGRSAVTGLLCQDKVQCLQHWVVTWLPRYLIYIYILNEQLAGAEECRQKWESLITSATPEEGPGRGMHCCGSHTLKHTHT